MVVNGFLNVVGLKVVVFEVYGLFIVRLYGYTVNFFWGLRMKREVISFIFFLV